MERLVRVLSLLFFGAYSSINVADEPSKLDKHSLADEEERLKIIHIARISNRVVPTGGKYAVTKP